ncbi:MAG TPA: MATE family efflux transporter, partial [Salinivirgaceae bacterium]|nr:MATE family efflux transporter [Salinivirgaceae bacterium]
LASVVVTILGLLSSRIIFSWMNVPADVFDSAVIYLNISFAGSIIMFGFNVTISILRGIGDSVRPLYFLILSSMLNVVFDLTFVLYFKMGVGSVAFATVLAQAVSLLVSIIYLNKKQTSFKIHQRKMYFNRELFLKSFRIGLPTGFQQTFVALGMMTIIGLVNQYGATVAAAYTAVGRIDAIASMPAMNLATALSIFTGQNLGAGKISRVRRGLWNTLLISGIVCLLVSLFVWFKGDVLLKLFTDDAQVVEIGKRYLLIVSSFYLFFSTMFSFTGLLRGAGATLVPMFISLMSLWIIRIPIAYFLSDKIGIDGIWWSIPISWFFGMVGSFFYYRSNRWTKSIVVKRNERSVFSETN